MCAVPGFVLNRSAFLRLRVSALVLVGGAVLSSLLIFANAPPVLSGNLVGGGSALRLELQGTTGTEYTIESSIDLSKWSHVADGPALNGILGAEVSLINGGPKRFFRARESSGGTVTFPTNVVVGANTNLSVMTIVTTNGGSAVVYAPDGTQFTFTVPPFTLPESQLVTITLVTNIGGLPFSGGLLGGVRLEPEGLDLWGAGTLEISLPPNVDRRKIVSFGANNDGTEFHLTPDRVTTNGVVIPIVQLGVYGSAVGEASEISAAGTSGLTEPTALEALEGENQSETGVRSASISLNDCFPERTEIARLVGRNLSRSIRATSQDIATALAAARQAQLLGVTEDTFDASEVLNTAEDATCRLIREQIEPYFADATSNCELMKILLVKTLGMERQRQLLGAEPNPACSSVLSDFPLCAGLQNCLREIELCCIGGRKGPGKVAAIRALSRQDQLLGSGCLSSSAIEEAIGVCSSNAWTGTLSFNARSERVETVGDQRSSVTTTERFSAQFYGEVWESQELIFGEFGGTVHLRLRGRVAWDEYFNDTRRTEGECGGYYSVDESRTVSATDTWFRVDLSLNPGGTYGLLAAHIDSNTGISGAEATDTSSYYSRIGRKIFTDQGSECVNQVEARTTTHRDVALIPPVTFFNGTMSSNSVTGGADVKEFMQYPPTDGRYEWSFERHRVE